LDFKVQTTLSLCFEIKATFSPYFSAITRFEEILGKPLTSTVKWNPPNFKNDHEKIVELKLNSCGFGHLPDEISRLNLYLKLPSLLSHILVNKENI